MVPRGWRLGGRGDADHIRIPDGHHAEGDVLAARVIRAPDLQTDIRLCKICAQVMVLY